MTINTANTWEYKTITYIGNTSTAIDNDNSTGVEFQFWLSAGSGFSGGTYNDTSWNNDSDARVNPVNQINIQGTTGNYIQFAGLQYELGSNASDFEHRSYGEELSLCGRYYQKWADVNWILGVEGTRNTKLPFQFSTLMRANPTCTISGGSATNGVLAGTGVVDPKKEMVNLHFWLGVSGGLVNATFSGYTLVADAEL